MDEKHLLTCTKYLELNPVRAELVKILYDWQWSSARYYLDCKDDVLVKTEPLLKIVQKPWGSFLTDDMDNEEIELLRKHERAGRPIGDLTFIEGLEQLLGRNLKPQKQE
jgi:putative transposase